MSARSTTVTLSAALHILSHEIDSPDGVANAAIHEAAQRLAELRQLLTDLWPFVKAQHQAEHMLDGFGGLRVRPSDALFARLEAELLA